MTLTYRCTDASNWLTKPCLFVDTGKVKIVLAYFRASFHVHRYHIETFISVWKVVSSRLAVEELQQLWRLKMHIKIEWFLFKNKGDEA